MILTLDFVKLKRKIKLFGETTKKREMIYITFLHQGICFVLFLIEKYSTVKRQIFSKWIK